MAILWPGHFILEGIGKAYLAKCLYAYCCYSICFSWRSFAGKPKREIMDEYDLGKSTVER